MAGWASPALHRWALAESGDGPQPGGLGAHCPPRSWETSSSPSGDDGPEQPDRPRLSLPLKSTCLGDFEAALGPQVPPYSSCWPPARTPATAPGRPGSGQACVCCGPGRNRSPRSPRERFTVRTGLAERPPWLGQHQRREHTPTRAGGPAGRLVGAGPSAVPPRDGHDGRGRGPSGASGIRSSLRFPGALGGEPRRAGAGPLPTACGSNAHPASPPGFSA